MATTYEAIQTTTLGSPATSITFSSIAADWTDLRLVVTGTESTSISKRIQFNSDAGSSYSVTKINGNGGTAASQYQIHETYGIRYASDQYGDSASIPMFSTFDIFSYAGSTYKTVLVTTSSNQNGSGYVQRSVGLWRSTAAITTVSLVFASAATWSTGSSATLYGIKAAI
tara:strand:+ start:120 stop:629 length:510 start_codon:yes stop_codon:yes gene_type:complete